MNWPRRWQDPAAKSTIETQSDLSGQGEYFLTSSQLRLRDLIVGLTQESSAWLDQASNDSVEAFRSVIRWLKTLAQLECLEIRMADLLADCRTKRELIKDASEESAGSSS